MIKSYEYYMEYNILIVTYGFYPYRLYMYMW